MAIILPTAFRTFDSYKRRRSPMPKMDGGRWMPVASILSINFGRRASRAQSADHLTIFKTRLLKGKDISHCDDITFHATDFTNTDYFTGSIPHTRYLDKSIQQRRPFVREWLSRVIPSQPSNTSFRYVQSHLLGCWHVPWSLSHHGRCS